MDKLTLTKEKPDSVLHSLCSVSTTIKKGSTFRVEAKSDLLSQVASFLPKIKHANDSLSHSLESGKSTLEDVDIEALKDGDQHIEMDLGLGVFDYAPEDISKIPKKDVIFLKKQGDSSDDEDQISSLKLKPDSEPISSSDSHSTKSKKKKRKPRIQVLK